MNKEAEKMSFFDRYLSIWVAICIVVGIAIGKLLPIVPETLGQLEYANVSIPIAVLIWIMIFPMMLKIDFKSVVDAVKMPKGLTITLVVNWLIKPFTMFGFAWCGSVYGNGVCVESFNQRESCLHLGTSSHQRFNHYCSFYSYCNAFIRRFWYRYSVEYAHYVGFIVCSHSLGACLYRTQLGYPQKRYRLFY